MSKPQPTPSLRQKAAFAHRELEELAHNKVFQNAILLSKRNYTKRLQGAIALSKKRNVKIDITKEPPSINTPWELCHRFNLTDLDWVSYVVHTWAGKGPLPSPDNPILEKGRRHKHRDSCITQGFYQGNRFGNGYGLHGFVSETADGSPRLWRQKLYQRDELGAEWLTLRIRLTPDLSAEEVATWVKQSLRKRKQTSKKPSMEPIAMRFLESDPKNKRKTIWALSNILMNNFGLGRTTAKYFARQFQRLPHS